MDEHIQEIKTTHNFTTHCCHFFAWNVPLVSLIFLKSSLVFPILLFSSISLHWSLRNLSYLFLLFFGTLHSDGNIFPFLLCLLLLFLSQLFVRPSETIILPFCISLFGEGFDHPPVEYYKPPSIVFQTLFLSVLIRWIYVLLSPCNCKGFD